MSFSSPSYPEGGYESRTPNIQATGGMTGRLTDDSGGVTGYGNAVLTKGVGHLTWEALAYLETIHKMVQSQIDLLNRHSSMLDQLERKLSHLENRVSSCQEFVEALVTIPPWTTKSEVEMGDDMVGERPAAGDLELRPIYRVRRRVQGFPDGGVIDISPSPGTLVRRGSFVLVTINAV